MAPNFWLACAEHGAWFWALSTGPSLGHEDGRWCPKPECPLGGKEQRTCACHEHFARGCQPHGEVPVPVVYEPSQIILGKGVEVGRRAAHTNHHERQMYPRIGPFPTSLLVRFCRSACLQVHIEPRTVPLSHLNPSTTQTQNPNAVSMLKSPNPCPKLCKPWAFKGKPPSHG